MAAPLKECKVYFNPVQEGSGDPSPDNVRAITGWTNLGIMHKNGLPSEYQAVEYLQSTGTQFITGYFTPPTTGVITLKVVLEPESMTDNYWYCGGRSNGNVSMQVGRYTGTWYKDRDSDIYKVISVTNGIEKIFCSKSYNTSLSYDYLLFGRAWNASNPYSCKIFQCTLYFNDIPIYNYIPCYRKIDNVAGMYDTINNVFYTNEGTGTFITGQNIQTLPRPLLFESTHSFDWNSTFGTIYGGHIDLINGELVQAWKSITLNGEETWSSQAPHTFSNIDYDTMFLSDSLSDMVYQQSTHGIISNMPTSTTASQKSNTGILCGQFGWSDRRFYIFNATQYLDGVSNVATLKAYLSQNPIQICYKLATPIHYTLTPTQLKTLRGTNNIWSNSNGDIQIQFWKH